MATDTQSQLIPRLYGQGDAEAVDRLIGEPQSGNVLLDRDRIVVLGRPPRGLLVWRPGGIVHELRTGNGLGQRARADLLVNFAVRDALSQPFNLWEAVFVTDSTRMARYAFDIGAVEEVGMRVFTLDLRGKQ